MADSVIGSLRAILQLDTAAFASGAKEAETSLGKLEAAFASTAKKLAVGLGAAAIAKQFSEGIKGMIDKADELGKAAQKFGVPVEALSALKYAADLADVSFESLGKGLGKLSKAMLDGLVNPGSEAAKTFKALGVSVNDGTGKLRATEDVFGDIAEKFSKLEDGAGKTALAIRVFGKGGAELIPLLNEGRDGIKKLTDEAATLGIVISGKTANGAQEFNDTLKRISTISQAFYLQAAEQLLPVLQRLADMFLESKKNGTVLKDLLGNLITQADLDEVTRYAQYWENFARIWSAILAFPSVSWTKGLSAGLKSLDDALAENQNKLSMMNDKLKGTWDPIGVTGDALVGLGNKGKKTFDDLDLGALKVRDSFTKWLDSTKRQADAQIVANKTIDQATGFAERYKFITEALQKAKDDQVTVEGKVKTAIDETAASIQLLAQSAELKSFIEQGKSDWDQYVEKIEKVKASIATFPDEAAKLAKSLAKIQQDMNNNIAGSLATAVGGFAQLLTVAAGKNKQLFQIAKAFAIAEAVINTYKAANQALAAPPGPPFSYIYVAGAIAAGLANVIKIQQQQPPSAAAGGSFRVPGGMMGVDTRTVSMNLAPGELVEVTPANKAGGSGDRTLLIPSISPKDFFTGDTVRHMVASIDQWMRDGGTGIRMVPR